MRVGTSSLLLALLSLGPLARAAPEAPPPVRALRVKAVADEPFRDDTRRYDIARRLLEQARDQDPNAEEVHSLIGVIHLERNEPADAEESLKKAVRARADYGDAFYQLGRLYQQQGRDQDAIGELRLAVESRSLGGRHRSEAHYRLTQLFIKKEQYDEAWKHGRTAKKLGSADVDPLLGQLATLAPEPAAPPP